MAGNIVVEWLRSLHLGQYAESFLDNGYDDLEICKQVGDPDLDAIGVFNPAHRGRLLASVRTLREEGAASVYFTLEETVAATTALVGKDPSDDCSCGGGDVASRASDKSSSAGAAGASPGAASSSAGSASGSGSAELCGSGAVARYTDEYEEGKAELVRFPRMQLKLLLRERVAQDGVRLSAQPYSTAVFTCDILPQHLRDFSRLPIRPINRRTGTSQIPRRAAVILSEVQGGSGRC